MKKKTIAYLLGAAAILCLVVGGVKLVREQKAGEEYEELREEAKTEKPETVEAGAGGRERTAGYPVVQSPAGGKSGYLRRITIRALTWITPSAAGGRYRLLPEPQRRRSREHRRGHLHRGL